MTTLTEEDLLKGTSAKIRDAYFAIKNIVHEINRNVEERLKETMVGYRVGGRGLIWVKPQRKSITIWLRKGDYKDTKGEVILPGWGGYPEIYISEDEFDVQSIRDLITQAGDN